MCTSGRAWIRSYVQRAVARNFAMACAVGEVARRVRMEAVRNFMSSRIAAVGRLRSRVVAMSTNRMPDGSKGLSNEVG